LPYGTTACKWDTIIPLEPLWAQYRRIAKPKAAIVLTASQPFTTAIISSNLKHFKYCWVWEKSISANFGVLKWQPAKKHEDIAVFCNGSLSYYPQMVSGRPYVDRARSRGNQINEKSLDIKTPIVNMGTRHPSSIITVANPNNSNIHPTQKPVALFEYLIRTYTNEGQRVLDNCSGSGTTAVACESTNRRWVCIEQNEEYYMKSKERITLAAQKTEA